MKEVKIEEFFLKQTKCVQAHEECITHWSGSSVTESCDTPDLHGAGQACILRARLANSHPDR